MTASPDGNGFPPLNSGCARSGRRLLLAAVVALAGVLLILAPVEASRWSYIGNDARPLVAWMASFNADTTLISLWLLLFPVAWLFRRHLIDEQGPLTRRVERWLQAGRYDLTLAANKSGLLRRDWQGLLLGLVCGLFGIGHVLLVGARLGDLPPAFHDEYSYWFQAETLLQGRISNPRFEAAPELFDQMHVLNDRPGGFASRYFPGTGLWLAPFLANGTPYLGHAIAQGVLCLFVCLLARDLAGNGIGILVGLLTAALPGLALFGNLLLSHHPGLVGLGLFWWMFHRWILARRGWQAFLAGTGLAFAMWCRPMTAFGIGLPYGVWFLMVVCREPGSVRNRLAMMTAIGSPLLIGILSLLPFHREITGSYWRSPYQVYTQLHTPRHVYGFYNRSRGERWIQARAETGSPVLVIEHYDRWAEELTVSKSLENERNRLIATGQWTLGILPALAAVLFFLAIGQRDRPDWWLIFAAAISLHLVHVPYWYDGIMHWHYVLEAAPLIVLMFGRCTQLIAWNMRAWNRHWVTIWWLGFPACGLLTATTSLEPLWESRLTAGISEVQFARQKHAEFNAWIDREVQTPAVVAIRQDPTDLHLDYVINRPQLNTPMLRVRWLPEQYPVEALRQLFPDRQIYLADLVEQRIVPLSATPQP